MTSAQRTTGLREFVGGECILSNNNRSSTASERRRRFRASRGWWVSALYHREVDDGIGNTRKMQKPIAASCERCLAIRLLSENGT